jgi:hypothetical protein
MRINLTRDTIGAAAAVGTGLAVLAAGIALASGPGTDDVPNLDPISISVPSTTTPGPDTTAPEADIGVVAPSASTSISPTTVVPTSPPSQLDDLQDDTPPSTTPIREVPAAPQVVTAPAPTAPPPLPPANDLGDDVDDDPGITDDDPGVDADD